MVEDDEGVSNRIPYPSGEPIEDEPMDEVVTKVVLDRLNELLLRVRRIEEYLGIADN